MADLAKVNQKVSLGLNVAGAVIPAITGLVKSIASHKSDGGQIEYTVVISTGQSNLDTAATNFQNAIADIDAQLAEPAQAVATVLHNPGQ